MIFYVLIGLASGVISGMGIGGGTLLIPMLCLFSGVSQQTAQSINLIYFVPTAIAALIVHFKNGNIEKKLLKPIILSGLLASAAGALIAVNIDSLVLRKCFGGFLFAMGIHEFFKKDK